MSFRPVSALIMESMVSDAAAENGILRNLKLETLMEEEERAAVAVALSNWGCCVRCVLRFLGERNQDIYRLPLKELDRWLSHLKGDGDNVTSTGDNGVCVTCLGILQEGHCSTTFLDKIAEMVKSENFEYKSFFCSFTLPVAILLREHAIGVLLKEILPFRSLIGGCLWLVPEMLHMFQNSAPKDVYTETKMDTKLVKDVWKWMNGPALAEKLTATLEQRASFEVALTFEHPDTAQECFFLCDLYPDQFRKQKNRDVFSKVRVAKFLGDTDDSTLKSCYQCPPKRLDKPCSCVTIRCKHDAVYVAGRYNKYSRTLSQTPWIIDGSRKTESSIEELVCTKIQTVFRADEYKFSASGREDVDVKMLGTGRPFVMDMTNAHRETVSVEEMRTLQKEINSSTTEIAVRDLQIVTKEETSILKEGEELKTKSYSAVCWSRDELTQEHLKKLESIKDLTLQQKTPIRVLHRRPLGTREKCIHKISSELLDPHHFSLHLSTQAGTYIKEFVHGDFGRTKPSLGELLQTQCDILQLNVENVELDWPKNLDSSV